MDTPVTAQESHIPSELFSELKQIKRQYIEDVLPSVKRHRYFLSERQRKSRPHNVPRLNVRFSPFAMTLGYGVAEVSSAVRTPPRMVSGTAYSFPPPRPVTQPNQLVSVFVIAMIQSDPPLYVMQKIQKKAALGFPGGSIETGETILQTASREFREETSGKDKLTGVDISRYNPTCVGQFLLNRATNGEQGAVVLVEIPESEKSKILAGGGDQDEGELVEEIFFLTFEELLLCAEAEIILPNAKKVLDIYLNHLVN